MMSDDESVRRLRSVDPAQGQATDLASLRRAVDARLGAEGPGAALATPRGTDELAARRARRSRRMSWVAGAAASVIVGVSGYLVGIGSGGGADSGGGGAEDAGPLVASEEAATAADDEGDSVVTDQGAGGDAADGGAEADEEGMVSTLDGVGGGTGDMSAEGGRIDFSSSGLSDQGGSAEAFAFDATGVATAARVQQIADAIGVNGTARQESDAWSVSDAEGRRVAIILDGTATFAYLDPNLDPGACGVAGADVSDPDELSACGAPGLLDDPIAAARDFLESVGVDVSQLELQVDFADPTLVGVSGYAAGASNVGTASWYVSVAPTGIYSAGGWLAPLTSLGDYDVISSVEAVERLVDPRFGALVTGHPPEYADGTPPATTSWSPTEGGAIPWAVTTYTITGAELTLTSYPLSETSYGVLPTWELTSDDGGTWLVLAVTDDFLDFDATWD